MVRLFADLVERPTLEKQTEQYSDTILMKPNLVLLTVRSWWLLRLIGILRLFRLARLAKAFRVITLPGELHIMVHDRTSPVIK